MLSAIIAAEIADGGPMPFRRFMELALYHPEHGYYASGRARVGRAGDFFTNVSVGPLFGRLLARQFAEMWTLLGKPADFSIVEQGAHGGEFAADVLNGLRRLSPECADATTYRIVEPSAVLAAAQHEKLDGLRVEWHESIPNFTGVHVSNELPDAFPVHLVKWTGTEWVERCVVGRDGRFEFADAPITSSALSNACGEIPGPLPAGYVTEINLAAREWIADVARKLTRGYVLAVDYGYEREAYFAPERASGTLSAYANHRRELDPLARPGQMDLTAHVEFTSLIEAAAKAGLKLAGFTDQHHFMVGLGAGHFADGANAGERRAFQTLMHPQAMGTAFKVVCFAKGVDARGLTGFQFARAGRDA